MPLQITKPEFNLRAKLNELDGRVPVDKMPIGSRIGFAWMEMNDGAAYNSTSWSNTNVLLKYACKRSDSLLHLTVNLPYWMSSHAQYGQIRVVANRNDGVEHLNTPEVVGHWQDQYQNNYQWSGMQNFERIFYPHSTDVFEYRWQVKRTSSGGLAQYFPNDHLDNTNNKALFYIEEIRQ